MRGHEVQERAMGMKRIFGLVCAAMVLALSFGCASRFAQEVSSPLPPETAPIGIYPENIVSGDILEIAYHLESSIDDESYRIGFGDILSVRVSNHPELEQEAVLVLPDGTVMLEQVGWIRAFGLTAAQLTAVAEKAYVSAGLFEPEVFLTVVKAEERVKEFMRMLGADSGSRLQVAVFEQDYIELPLIAPVKVKRPLEEVRAEVRKGYNGLFGGRLNVSVNLLKRAPPKLYVLGEVMKPGEIELTRPVNLLMAIASAGGFRETADEGAVLVVRFDESGTHRQWVFDLDDGLLTEGGSAFAMHTRDVVYVARSPISEANLAVKQYVRDLLPIQMGIGVGWSLNN